MVTVSASCCLPQGRVAQPPSSMVGRGMFTSMHGCLLLVTLEPVCKGPDKLIVTAWSPPFNSMGEYDQLPGG